VSEYNNEMESKEWKQEEEWEWDFYNYAL